MNCSLTAMTKAQRKWLLRALPPHSYDGTIKNYDFSAAGMSLYERMCSKLSARGVVEPEEFGKFKITDAGRTIASCMIGDRAYEVQETS